ncbi:MAG: DUF6282 family protein, partial [Candidatus Bathyarchaeia archaeon]
MEIPQQDQDLLRGVIDLHIHTMPSVFDRPFDALTLSRQGRAVGYRAILFKCHHAINADCMYIVRKTIPGIEAFGGVVLNYAVGGFNPAAVDAAIGLGAKEIWMPTMNAANHDKVFGKPEYLWHKRVIESKRTHVPAKGLTILADGEVIKEIHEILGLIADADIVLGTGHISLEEVFALIKAAKDEGVKKILVTHPEWEATTWSIEDQMKMAEMGAVMEHCFNALMPFRKSYDPTLMVEAIRRVGADR